MNWNEAQIAERSKHNMSYDEGLKHYRKTYRQGYFKYLNINPILNGKKVAEIGPADFPALAYCEGTENSLIVEPMPSDILESFKIPIVCYPAEDMDFSDFDEVWIFNVLQHVIDPGKIVDNAKKAKCVRFFEPINFGTDECHLHNLTMEMFVEWFGEAKYYPKNDKAEAFHTWECAYGNFYSY